MLAVVRRQLLDHLSKLNRRSAFAHEKMLLLRRGELEVLLCASKDQLSALDHPSHAMSELVGIRVFRNIISRPEPHRFANGLEVLQQLRAIDPAAMVIMATADVQSSTRQLAMAGGAVGFVTKPLNRDEVLAAVSGALEPAAQ